MKSLNKVLLSSLMMIAISMVACAKKDDRNSRATLARPADAVTSNLQNQLTQQGIQPIIHSLSKVNNQNGYQVETRIQIGNDTKTVGFNHNYDQTQTYQNVIGGLQYRATSYCYFSTNCRDYVIMFDIYYNGSIIYQLGIYRDFDNPNNDTNTIYKIVSGSQVSFDGMIDYLANAFYY